MVASPHAIAERMPRVRRLLTKAVIAKPGITADEIVAAMYGDRAGYYSDPRGNVRSCVARCNKELRLHGYEIRAVTRRPGCYALCKL